MTKKLRSLTSQAPRQKKHSLTTCIKHINFYLVRDYTKNMRSLTSQRLPKIWGLWLVRHLGEKIHSLTSQRPWCLTGQRPWCLYALDTRILTYCKSDGPHPPPCRLTLQTDQSRYWIQNGSSPNHKFLERYLKLRSLPKNCAIWDISLWKTFLKLYFI